MFIIYKKFLANDTDSFAHTTHCALVFRFWFLSNVDDVVVNSICQPNTTGNKMTLIRSLHMCSHRNWDGNLVRMKKKQHSMQREKLAETWSINIMNKSVMNKWRYDRISLATKKRAENRSLFINSKRTNVCCVLDKTRHWFLPRYTHIQLLVAGIFIIININFKQILTLTHTQSNKSIFDAKFVLFSHTKKHKRLAMIGCYQMNLLKEMIAKRPSF